MFVSPLLPIEAHQYFDEQTARIGAEHVKSAGDAKTVQALRGRLTCTEDGWVMLSVPNALVRGAFDALHIMGSELPYKDGKLNAHISVIRPEELEQIGGKGKIHELGHALSYTLGPIQEVEPDSDNDISRVWMIKVISTELQNLRKSYGLSAMPKNGQYDFHITVAVRRKHVLKEGDKVVKASGEACPHCQTLLEIDPDSGVCNRCGKQCEVKTAQSLKSAPRHTSLLVSLMHPLARSRRLCQLVS